MLDYIHVVDLARGHLAALDALTARAAARCRRELWHRSRAQRTRGCQQRQCVRFCGNAVVELIDESVPPVPENDYAVSKLAMEHMARLWFDRLPVFITRPFNYTGVGQDRNFVVPKIVAHYATRAREIELGSLDVAREFSDVRMVASAYRRLIDAAPAGETFNVCSGIAYSLSEVLAMMSAIAGYDIAVKVNPALVRTNEVKRLVGSNAKLKRMIGDLPSIPLFETLRWMYSAAVAQQ